MDRKLTEQMMHFLPELGRDEVFLLVGGARKKYAPEISKSHEVVIRKIIRENDPIKFADTVEKMHNFVINSRDSGTGEKFPEHAVALYINPIPRSMIKAYDQFQKKISSHYYQLVNGHDKDLQNSKQIKRMDVHLYSAIQNQPSKIIFNNCDIDVLDRKVFDDLIYRLNKYIQFATVTRGGWHIVYRPPGNKEVYEQKLKEKYPKIVEWRKDTLTPIWGTLQGGHLVQPVEVYSSSGRPLHVLGNVYKSEVIQ